MGGDDERMNEFEDFFHFYGDEIQAEQEVGDKKIRLPLEGRIG